ncbi:hypothetical protein [Leptospira noguchii]|uniref:Uncharacterized protein n=1 Tax=Leptospira noguchii TaxID=28182 RepID=A0AAE9K9I7_9LEPT|nr:hypothetical protein [Leptospira noguchii]UOG29359.1 hypothetical protein MAL06_11720 [Leptospira noguchii]UOG35298.1 hypothetical protein MAL02_06250 [Leptospira noguchii]UOG46213.1 hypothetical protein MAL01_06390 [Leptospira noguchii]UOG53883.1 hypothetical protein MAL09_07195 [Leptospira noguchii]UOG55502.1 hypothetical protein MAL03_11345 [Leptospira noguchii]
MIHRSNIEFGNSEGIGVKNVVVKAILALKYASCDDDPGNSVNAYLWVGVHGVVALSSLFTQIFFTSNLRYFKKN